VCFPALGVGFLTRLVPLVAAALWLFVLTPTAHAAFPGVNGKIAVEDRIYGSFESYIATMNADGSGLTRITSNPGDFRPAWSPDGQKIAFTRILGFDGTPGSYDNSEIWTMNADGSGQTRLTNNSVPEDYPAWSPDGIKIIFTSGGIWTMNADGSGRTNVSTRGSEAVWSPDGTKIAFRDFANGTGARSIYTMSPDGSGVEQLTQGPCFDYPNSLDNDELPEWSPDGAKIVFQTDTWTSCSDEAEWLGTRIRTVNRDGTGGRQLSSTTCCPEDRQPVWSPDGKKIAFIGFTNDVRVMNADGTDEMQIASGTYLVPDWQPVLPPSYPHPVGASPLEVPFVPAFRPCETGNANSQHGAPLGFPSCSNPTPTSSTVRIGPNTLSLLRIVVCPVNATSAFCNPAAGMPKPDVRFAGSIRDIRCATVVPAGCTPGADYNPNTNPGPYTDGGNGKGGAQPPCLPRGSSTTACVAGADLTQVAEIPGASRGGIGTPFEGRGLRITDRQNGFSGNGSATVTDIGFPVPLDCIPTPSSSQGSTCGVNTTANALVPGVVINGDTAVWQIGQVELKDSGPDGVRGDSDDELFATQGVFLP
jgi:Tol biopolymer transport system component